MSWRHCCREGSGTSLSACCRSAAAALEETRAALDADLAAAGQQQELVRQQLEHAQVTPLLKLKLLLGNSLWLIDFLGDGNGTPAQAVAHA